LNDGVLGETTQIRKTKEKKLNEELVAFFQNMSFLNVICLFWITKKKKTGKKKCIGNAKF